MKESRIQTTVLSVKMIPNADPALLRSLSARSGERSLGLITTDCDDVSYAALDEATKKAQVRVLYAQSMYAGAKNASTRLAGEFIGILAGSDPEEVRASLNAVISYIENEASFVSACDDDSIVYFAHCISRTGTYLSGLASVEEGTAMAYLIAPPLEAMLGIDAALKSANVEIKLFYGPPTNTNFAGGLLVGAQSACKAACEAFAEKICEIAALPCAY